MFKERMKKPLFSFHITRFCTVSTTPRRLIGGGLFFAVMLALVLWHAPAFAPDVAPQGTLLFWLCIAACVILAAMTAVRWSLTDKTAVAVSLIVFFLLPIVCMTMVECLNGIFTWDWSPQTLLLNYILYFLFYGLVYVFSGSIRLPMLIVNPLFFALALTNYYVYAFRGTPFIPMDFLAAGTAANVVAGYDFSFNYQIVIAIILLAFLQVAGFKLRTPRLDMVGKIASRAFFGTLIVCIVGIYFFTDEYANVGLRPDFWNQARGYHRSGVVLNFCLNTKYMYMTKPAGYDADEVEGIVYGYLGEDSGVSSAAEQPESPPNILCIMNESLADLNVLGDVRTNTDCMPFLRGLTENTVRGNLYVSVIGSGTSNTEFEFLTGVPTAFFPAGSNAYMLYVKNPLYSLVSTLGSHGFSKTAFHPYYSSGWNRINVYNFMGFSDFRSITSVIDWNILAEYQNSGYNAALFERMVEDSYPDENVLVRRYVSDSCNYRKAIEMFEERDPDVPFFLFNVTMQNHGSYTEQAENFQEGVYVTDDTGAMATRMAADGSVAAYPKANQYFSLMQRSDEAFEELLDYFSGRPEKTVICMFGDHQPNIETSYISNLLGVSSLYNMTTEQEQKRYVTPFYIWANYDIEEQYIDKLSANYLSSYLLQIAGLDMPAYNRYLLKLSETLPVINTVGYIDAQDGYYANGADTPYDDLIRGYQKVAYNLMFDEENKKDALFQTTN